MTCNHGFKNRTGHQTVFFLNFRFNPGFWPVFRFLTGCWPVLGVLTGPDWLPVLGWTGRTGRSGPVFKTVLATIVPKKRVVVGLEKRREILRHVWYCNVDYNIIRISITILIKKKKVLQWIKRRRNGIIFPIQSFGNNTWIR